MSAELITPNIAGQLNNEITTKTKERGKLDHAVRCDDLKVRYGISPSKDLINLFMFLQ